LEKRSGILGKIFLVIPILNQKDTAGSRDSFDLDTMKEI
jgi:hypothetical protein